MAVVTMKQLLEAGVHFGHQTRRWNPKMKRFIFGERNGIYIIDLNQTLSRIETAYTFTRDLVADGGTVLFIGTKKQTQDPIARYAQQCGMPYVNERWLGGMLTNFTTISARVKKMQEYERMKAAGDFEAMPKKEALILSRELEKLQRNLGGIRSMNRLPEAVFVIDTKKEHLAVTEANKLGVPVVAVVDTNCDPDLVQYVIPGNDDAIRAGNLLCRVIADAVEEGRLIGAKRAGGGRAEAAAPAPPTPEQLAEREAQQAEARRQFAEQAREREARLAATLAGTSTAATDPDRPAPLQESIGEETGGALDALADAEGAPTAPATAAPAGAPAEAGAPATAAPAGAPAEAAAPAGGSDG
jgi:small subunit ribosomal protein S2